MVFYNSTIKCYSVISCDNIHEQKGSTMYMFDWLSVVRLLILAVFTLIFGERNGSDLTGEHRISSLSHCPRCHCVVSLSNIIHCQILVKPTKSVQYDWKNADCDVKNQDKQKKERCGSVVAFLTWDLGAAGSSLPGVTALCPWARHINPSLVLVQPMKTGPYITERLFVGRKESNQTNKQKTNKSFIFAFLLLLFN